MLVSVIIPTYNRAGTIRRAVDSVLNQTWKDLEIIVVDDGSTDHTADVLAECGDKIRLLRQQNQGASAARNSGIRMAKGEIISFLDSDDEWLSEKIERQVRLLQQTKPLGVKCCVCNATMRFAKGTVTSFSAAGLHPRLSEGIWTNPADLLMSRFFFFNQVVAVRRDALDQAGSFREDLRIMEDYDLALRLSLIGPWGFISEPLVIWHEDAGSGLSRKLTELEKAQHALRILDDLSFSPKFGPLLNCQRLRLRRYLLRRHIGASASAIGAETIRTAFANLTLFGLRIFGKVYDRSPFSPRMATRPL